ncbi:MAG: zinc dependent phospholipase C family protein [Anaerolineae bacterium]|nr:zinc dependent phospholipase C family protein [Anaerolineae bacterium]
MKPLRCLLKAPSPLVVLSAILVVVAILSPATPAEADGLITHVDIVDRAIGKLDNYGDADLKAFLNANRDVLHFGAMFPDVGYSIRITEDGDVYDQWAEKVHDTDDLKLNCKVSAPPRTGPPSYRSKLTEDLLLAFRKEPRDARSIAFLFGLISHQEADIPFHFGNEYCLNGKLVTTPGLLAAWEKLGYSHTETEIAMDERLYDETDAIDWWYPESVIRNQWMPDLQVLGTLPHGTWLMQDWYNYEVAEAKTARALNGGLTAEEQRAISSWVNYYPGGLDHSALRTVTAWRQTWNWLQQYKPVTEVVVKPARPDGNNGWYRSNSVEVAFSATDNFLGWINLAPVLNCAYYPAGRPAQLCPRPSGTISADGVHTFSANSQDRLGIVSDQQVVRLAIDRTAPAVDVEATDQQLTRADSVMVRGSDPAPGSGLASLTLNGKPVSDGQQVDLFWLPLGTNAFTVRGEDVAGGVTEKRVDVQVAATLESLRAVIGRLCAESHITNRDACGQFSSTVRAAQKILDRGYPTVAVAILRARERQIQSLFGKSISQEGAALLLDECRYLIAELTP